MTHILFELAGFDEAADRALDTFRLVCVQFLPRSTSKLEA